jgi:hypothetical protein
MIPKDLSYRSAEGDIGTWVVHCASGRERSLRTDCGPIHIDEIRVCLNGATNQLGG